jgi:integrase
VGRSIVRTIAKDVQKAVTCWLKVRKSGRSVGHNRLARWFSVSTGHAMLHREAPDMIRRRATAAGIYSPVSCHSFRATGITIYLENGGMLETAQKIAAHESPWMTKLYDRTNDQLTLNEIERITV